MNNHELYYTKKHPSDYLNKSNQRSSLGPTKVASAQKLDDSNIMFTKNYALKTGLHIGHRSLKLSKTNYWHPLMSTYFLGIRHKLALIDPLQTKKCILRAFYVIALLLKTKMKKNNNNFDLNFKLNQNLLENKIPAYHQHNQHNKKSRHTINNDLSVSDNTLGHILIVNTNPEFSQLCKKLTVLTLHNNKVHIKNQNIIVSNNKKKSRTSISFPSTINTSCFSFVHYKWVGGTLTNWKQVSKSVLTYAKFSERCEKFLYHNNIDFPRYKKIKESFQGLIRKKYSNSNKMMLAFTEKPDLVFLMNPNENRHIIAEANKMHIPVIGLVESNTSLEGISYPIPVNAYSAFFIYYCFKKIFYLSINKDEKLK